MRALAEVWTWRLALLGFPLALCGMLLRALSARRSGWWKLGSGLLDAGVTCLAIAAVLYFVLPLIEEQLRGLPWPGGQ